MRRTTLVAISILLVMAVTLAACGNGQPAADADQHIIIATNNDPPTFDPAKSNDGASILIWNQIYETVVAFDVEENEVVPALAEDWDIIDETTIHFYIR